MEGGPGIPPRGPPPRGPPPGMPMGPPGMPMGNPGRYQNRVIYTILIATLFFCDQPLLQCFYK